MSGDSIFNGDEVYVTAMGDFALICRHCRKTKEKHVEERCLFDSTEWVPMTQAEFEKYWQELYDSIRGAVLETSVKT